MVEKQRQRVVTLLSSKFREKRRSKIGLSGGAPGSRERGRLFHHRLVT